VREYLEGWIDSKEKTIKSSTATGYRKAINGVLVPALGEIELLRLKRPDVRAMCVGMTAGNKRIGNVLSVLRTALDDAVQDEILDHNPIAGWAYKKNEPPKDRDEVDPFTREEQARILEQLEGQGRNLIQFALWTGLRTAWLCGPMWQDLDEVGAEMRVRRTIAQDTTSAETTKTSRDPRTVGHLVIPLATEEI